MPASPRSVRLARAWVTEVLTEINRPELTLTAQLAVSELVTNAILHAKPPLTVSVSGTATHPRIAVTDHTPGPLRPTNLFAVDDDFPTTFGRGLALVALNSCDWGVETGPDGVGKTIWFEPAREMHEDTDLADIFDPDDVELLNDAPEPPADSIRITLTNVPARLFGQLRRYHAELRREMRLLTLVAPEPFPMATALTGAFAQGDQERRASSGVNQLDDAIAQDLTMVNLELAVPPTVPATMKLIQDLLEQCYSTFADEHLLSMAPPMTLRELQAWYFGEFTRQGAGLPPAAWEGPFDLDINTTIVS